jgi:hypothetical protein
MVVMGYINFENQALIKRWWAHEKMNAMGGKLKNKKKWCDYQKWFLFLVESCECFRSFGNHISMSVESVIEKL